MEEERDRMVTLISRLPRISILPSSEGAISCVVVDPIALHKSVQEIMNTEKDVLLLNKLNHEVVKVPVSECSRNNTALVDALGKALREEGRRARQERMLEQLRHN